MTVPSSTSRISYAADGVTVAYPVPFRFLESSHLLVTTRAGSGTEVVESGTYTVTGAGNQSGGTVTFTTAKPSGTTIVITRNVPFTQEADYVDNDPFPAESHEDALDKLTMISQQQGEAIDRSLTLPITVSGVSTELPIPQASNLVGWNSGATGLRNFTTQEIASVVAFSNWYYDRFTATASQTVFTLSADPAVLGNLDVSIDGVTQVPVDDYTIAGTTLTMTAAMVGGERVLVRYGAAVPAGDGGAGLWTPAGTGAVQRTVQSKLREWVSVKDFGAVGDGVTNDTAAVQAFLSFGGALDWGSGTYRITEQAAITATKNVHWRSSGAKIVVDSASAIESAIKIELGGFSASLVGSLEIECQSKSYAGLLVLNNGGGLPTVEIDGPIVRNVYRSGTAFNYGDGILVFGKFGRVVVRNFEIHKVRMATGAGTPFVIGVTGVSVLRLNNTASDAESVLIEDFFIDQVYSEDVTYGARDQDGVRVQQAYSKNQLTDGTNPVFALVKNGRIKNAHGRAVKMVSEYGIVADIQVVRDGTIYSGFSPGSSEDFDFQVSGGSARGIRCYYNANCPESVFSFTCNLVDNRRSPNAVNVDDVLVSQFGGTFINRLASVAVETAPDNPLNIICNFANIHVGGTTTDLDEIVRLFNVNNLANTWYWAILLSNVTARVTTTFVYREQATVANDLKVTGISCHQARPATVPLATGDLLTGITTSLVGQNTRLS